MSLTNEAVFNANIDNISDEKYWIYSAARGIRATDYDEIERRTQPGTNVALSVKIVF